MSEHQYYEFVAIDRPLTKSQMNAVRNVSSRAEITSTRFTNEYHYGDFKGDPVEFLKHYFDAMIYTANWGTRQFMFRVPRDLVDQKTIKPYATQSSVNIRSAGAWLIIDLCYAPEDGGDEYFESDKDQMQSLIDLRAEVLSGDLRPLYLAWLLGLQMETIRADSPQPPVPPGLGKLSDAQKALVDFLEIDTELIEAAAQESANYQAPVLDLKAALTRVSIEEKDRWLLELMQAESGLVNLQLRSKLAALTPGEATPMAQAKKSAGDLLNFWQQGERDRKEQERIVRAAKNRKRAAEAAAERNRKLDALAKNIPGAWRDVERFINMRNESGYQLAIKLLVDLRDLASRPGGDAVRFTREFNHRLAEHRRKLNLTKLLEKAGLNLSS